MLCQLIPKPEIDRFGSNVQVQHAEVRINLDDVQTKVTQIVGKMLGKEIGPEQPIMEAGLDSLGAVELKSSLQTAFEVDLPATLTFDYPTISTLSKFLGTQLSAQFPVSKVWTHMHQMPAKKLGLMNLFLPYLSKSFPQGHEFELGIRNLQV